MRRGKIHFTGREMSGKLEFGVSTMKTRLSKKTRRHSRRTQKQTLIMVGFVGT